MGQRRSVGHILHTIVLLLVIFSYNVDRFEDQIDSSKVHSKHCTGTRTPVRSRRQAQPCNCPALWKENWGGHETELYRVYANKIDHVVVYFDPTILDGITQKKYSMVDNQIQSLQENPHWIFDFVSDVWRYMTKTYGSFGPDPYLYFVVHRHGDYQDPYIHYSLDPKNSKSGNKRNILDISSLRSDSWVNVATMSEEKDLITNKLAYFVEYSSKERWGSPSHDVWRRTLNTENAWADIFTYDVYQNLNMINEANRLSKNLVKKYENGPKSVTFWFRDWFLPIYSQYGNNGSLLNTYLDLLKVNVPSVNNRYSQRLNIGSFVHFWSAAASTDLRFQARTAFGWNETYQQQFSEAVERFPGLTGLYKISSECCSVADPTIDVTSPFAFKPDISLTYPNGSTRGGNDSQIPMSPRSPISFTLEISSAHSNGSSRDARTGLDSVGAITGIVAGAVVILSSFLILIAYVVLYRKRIQDLKSDIRALTTNEVNDFFEGDKTCRTEDAHTLVMSSPFIKDFEIERNRLIIATDRIIGSGQFGCVTHGFVQNPGNGELLPVAVKTVKADVEVLCFKAMLSEAKIMAYLGRNDNIVKLVGTCTANIKNREIFIALEFCPLGDLHTFLKKFKQNYDNLFNISEESQPLNVIAQSYTVLESPINRISTLDLLKWSQEITNAMTYLTEKKVIHGDLAARNVLLNANRVAQVSDFGLSRQLLNYDEYKKTTQAPLPWRWMAIESLREKQFSIASDVWAFGVTMWELFSLAETPYAGWTWDFAFMDKLDRGDRLLLPRFANQHVFKVMEGCWAFEAADRPSFKEINDMLGVINSDLLEQTRNDEGIRSGC